MPELFSHPFLTGAVLLLLLLSIICQIIIGVLFQTMIKEADNMSATENKLLKQCKLKFSNCYQLNAGVSNIPIFVDKFLSRIRIAGLGITAVSHLSGQLMMLSVFLSGLGICRGIIDGKTLGQLLPYYIVSLFGLYLYFSVSSIVDLPGKKASLKTNLVDYLENCMVSRLNFNLNDDIASKEWQPIKLESPSENEARQELPAVEAVKETKKEESVEIKEYKVKRKGKELDRKEAEELEHLLEKLLV